MSVTDAAPPAAPMGAPEGYDAVAVAKGLLRAIRAGALGTLARAGGHPFTSLVNVAGDVDGSPVVLMSRLALHTQNLAADPRASILLTKSGKGDPLAHPRLTVVGTMAVVEEPEARARLRRRFLARHPKSALYADFADFGFWRMAVENVHLNGGFARAADFPAADILTDVSGAGELIALEEGALEHMNADHAEAVRLYATRLAGEEEADWRAIGIDPEGIDLAAPGGRVARAAFPRPARTGADLRKILAEMAAGARTHAK